MGQGLLTGKVTHADQVQPGRQRSRLFSNKRPQQRHGEPGLEEETFASIRKMAWIAQQINQPLANVALSWAREQPGVTSLLMGARTADQLERNLESVKLDLVSAQIAATFAAFAEFECYICRLLLLFFASFSPFLWLDSLAQFFL